MSNIFHVDSEATVIDSRGILFGGVRFDLGDVFPHKDLKVIPLDLQGLHMAGLIGFSQKPASVGVLDSMLTRKAEAKKKADAEAKRKADEAAKKK